MAKVTVQLAVKGGTKVFKEVEVEQIDHTLIGTAEAVLKEENEKRGNKLPLVLRDAWLTEFGQSIPEVIDGDAIDQS